MLEELKLTPEQFADLCILCGCDYTGKIGGIGPVRALQVCLPEHDFHRKGTRHPPHPTSTLNPYCVCPLRP